MKNKQLIAIILMFSVILGVFCGCKSNEIQLDPSTPEITWSNDSPEDTDAGYTVAVSTEKPEQDGDTETKTTKKASEKTGETAKTTKTETKTTEKDKKETTASTKAPDNSVETKPKTTATQTTRNTATTTKKPSSTTKATTTKKSDSSKVDPIVTTTKPTTTDPTTTKKSTATVKPISAKFTYLNDPQNSFIGQINEKTADGFGMTGEDKSAFLSDRSTWAEYTVRIDFTNNDTAAAATVYMLEIEDNGKNGIYINGDPKGDFSISPGGNAYILFDILVKDGSMMETVVHKSVTEMTKKVKYAATPENDTDLPNYQYIQVK